MSKKHKNENKGKKKKAIPVDFTLDGVKEKDSKAVVISDELAAKEVLLDGMIENVVDETIKSLVDNGFREKDLLLFRDGIIEIGRKAFLEDYSKDEAQKDIARLLIDKLSPENRVYTDADIIKMTELGTKLTPKQFEKFGIGKKKLKEKVGEYSQYLSEKYGFIKEKLQNTLYKFFRDNWKVMNKEFDAEFRKVLLVAAKDHFDETKEARIKDFVSEIDNVKSEDVFNGISEEKPSKDKLVMRRTNPDLKFMSVPNDTESKEYKIKEHNNKVENDGLAIARRITESIKSGNKRVMQAIRA